MRLKRLTLDCAALLRGCLVIGRALAAGQDPLPFMRQVRRERLTGMPAIARLAVLLRADRSARLRELRHTLAHAWHYPLAWWTDPHVDLPRWRHIHLMPQTWLVRLCQRYEDEHG